MVKITSNTCEALCNNRQEIPKNAAIRLNMV